MHDGCVSPTQILFCNYHLPNIVLVLNIKRKL